MSVISTMSPKLRAAVGAGVLLMCWLAGTCTRQTPGAPSSNQNQPNQSAENTPPKPATAPTAAEEKSTQTAAPTAPPQSGNVAPAQAAAEQPAPTPPPPLVLPAGSALTVRTNSDISAKTSQPGTGFQAVVAQPVRLQGRIAIPAGASVTGVVVQAKQGGKIKGSSQLALQLTTLHLRDASYSLHTNQFLQEQKGKGGRTAKIGAGGAAGGAIIGGIAGGGKGAAVGTLLGGGAGVAGSAVTGNKELTIPAESLLSFKLTKPLRISATPAPSQRNQPPVNPPSQQQQQQSPQANPPQTTPPPDQPTDAPRPKEDR